MELNIRRHTESATECGPIDIKLDVCEWVRVWDARTESAEVDVAGIPWTVPRNICVLWNFRFHYYIKPDGECMACKLFLGSWQNCRSMGYILSLRMSHTHSSHVAPDQNHIIVIPEFTRFMQRFFAKIHFSHVFWPKKGREGREGREQAHCEN